MWRGGSTIEIYNWRRLVINSIEIGLSFCWWSDDGFVGSGDSAIVLGFCVAVHRLSQLINHNEFGEFRYQQLTSLDDR